MLTCALAVQTQRSCALRGEAEPIILKWGSVLWANEDDSNSAFFGEKCARHSSLEHKNGQTTMQKPRREKNERKMKVHRSDNGARREFFFPHQTCVFCKPCSEDALPASQHRCIPREPMTKDQCCSMVRSTAEHSKFGNAERVTAHGPRKHAHALIARHKVPLG